ncbi:hypothetical protein LEMLEM_LOCUS7091, partial [Lemmus lemmus]
MASSSIQGNHILQQILEFFCGSGDISECYGRPYLPRRRLDAYPMRCELWTS